MKICHLLHVAILVQYISCPAIDIYSCLAWIIYKVYYKCTIEFFPG